MNKSIRFWPGSHLNKWVKRESPEVQPSKSSWLSRRQQQQQRRQRRWRPGVGTWGRLQTSAAASCFNRNPAEASLSAGLSSEAAHYQSTSGLFWSTGSLMPDPPTPPSLLPPASHRPHPPTSSSWCCQQRCTASSNKSHSSHGKVRGCEVRGFTQGGCEKSSHHRGLKSSTPLRLIHSNDFISKPLHFDCLNRD